MAKYVFMTEVNEKEDATVSELRAMIDVIEDVRTRAKRIYDDNYYSGLILIDTYAGYVIEGLTEALHEAERG